MSGFGSRGAFLEASGFGSRVGVSGRLALVLGWVSGCLGASGFGSWMGFLGICEWVS